MADNPPTVAASAERSLRRLIVNADDFGRSHAHNLAVLRAHEQGILTSASLMVNGEAAAEAVEMARQHPRLGVGLHLTLVCGRSSLPQSRIPGLVDGLNNFSNDAARSGFRYYFDGALRPQLEMEITAQFERFKNTGLKLDHVNGHLNIHLHPVIFRLLLAGAQRWGIHAMRLTRDLFWLNVRLAQNRWVYRISHACIFNALSAWAGPRLERAGIHFTPRVFGLLQTGCVTEDFLLRLLPVLPPGESELYLHPSVDDAPEELAALMSPRVRQTATTLGVQLIRYEDL